MLEKQTTIKNSVSLEGIGLHTGNLSRITFLPAPADYGYRFVRTDLDEQIEIPALVDFVVDLSRGTTIGIGEVKVHTVEHVLASLAGLGIDNCKIELTANEPPVIDGSSIPYVNILLQAGIQLLEADRKYLVVEETVQYKNEEKGVEIVALPHEEYRLTVLVDYSIPALGSQHTGLFNFESEFVKEFAPARTFCFLTEVLALHRSGLIKGGSLESALVIVDKELSDEELIEIQTIFKLDSIPRPGDNGILENRSLRFNNEPARHKLLDLIGDLTLVGVPFKAQILAARPGHASNFEFAKKLREHYLKINKLKKYEVNKAGNVIFDINQIMEILPHRYPFLLVDRITHYFDDTQTIIGYKNVTMNEPFFAGHFPSKPVMPGVLILEAMAQTGGILILKTQGDKVKGKIAFFSSVNNAKFRKPVIPGDQLVMEVRLSGKKFNIFHFEAKALVQGQVVCEAELSAALVDK